MKLPKRQELAEEVVPLRHMTMVPDKELRTEGATEFVNSINRAQLDLMVELYLTYFTNEQLLALRDFYRSEIGQSIVVAERQIWREYQDQIRDRVSGDTRDLE